MSATRKGTVLVVCAPSGAGKTTLIKRLREEFPTFGFSISYTTRKAREGEVDGVDYKFVSVNDFKEKRDAGFFAEHAKVHGNCYGTPLKPSEAMLQAGQDLIFDVDVQGAAQLRLTIPSAVYIFILPPSIDELRRRLQQRGSDSQEHITQRISNAMYEIQEAHKFDCIIVNDNLDVAYDQLRSVYVSATLRPEQNPSIFTPFLEENTKG